MLEESLLDRVFWVSFFVFIGRRGQMYQMCTPESIAERLIPFDLR